MKITFNPSTVAALTTPPNNKDITFDLRGRNIFARGVKFYGTDTNTWRDIKINNVSIGSHTLDLQNGSNTTLTNTNGVVTINSTWRPVVDNLTSDSTTSSLSAKQGKVLKALIDGKSNSDHNHDGRYLKLTGGTMASNALITFADSGSWGTSKKPQGARGGLYWTGQSDYAKLYAEETVGDNLDLVIQFGDDNSNGLSIRNKANTQTSYISSSGVITTGTFKGNLDWSYITNKPATATRWPSWAEVTGKPSSFTPSTHTHGLSNSVFFLDMPSINGNAKWKEVFGYPVNYNLLLSVRINNPAPEWCVGNFGSGILYGGRDTKGFMSSAYNEPFIMWAGGYGISDDSVPKWYIGIKGTHKSIYNLATIASEANAAYNLRHSHANKSVLDGITSALVNSWNTAYNFVSNITGTDTDKVINKWEEIVNFLAGITEDNKLNTLLNSKLSVYELADNTNVGTIKNNGIYYSTTDASSRTLINSPFNTGFAFINMTSYDVGDDLRRSRLAFNAFGEIKVSDDRDQANTAETWYNVLTSKNSGINGSTIKLNGTSITVYSSGTADGRYVKKSGDTMSGVLTIDTPNFGALTIKRNDDANGASIQFRGKSSVYGYIGLNNSTKDKQFLRWSSDTSRIYTILDTSSTYISNGKGVINGTTITQVDNATNSTNSTNARKLVNWYSARPTSLNAQFGDGSLRIFYATSSTTEGKPAEDSHILHLAWDNTGGYDAQLAVHIRSGKVSTRAQNGGTWQPWKTLAFTTDIPTSLKNPYSFNVFGVVYDGSAAKTVTTSTFVSQLPEGTSTVTDGTMFITSWASNSGFADTNAVNVPYKRKAIHLWEYIKAKTDSLYATNGHNHDGKYLKLTGGTMLGALNFANNTWNLVGDDSYIGDCNISGHFGIKAANTTYPGITFFNNASTFLGNLTAYSGNIKYGAYSLQFLDNGNTSVSASTWTNPFSNYNSNAVADGQAICVWGQSSYLSNLSTDTGDMSLWLKRINAKVATLNMVLDGEYYAQGSQRLAHVSEIPNKDSWNYDDRYLRLTGGWMSGDINFGGDKKIYWGRNTDSASISFKNDGDGDANSYMSFVTSDNGNEYFRWSHSSGSTNTEWMALRSDGLRVRGTKVSLEGHTHDDRYYTKAESNAKYITDITTSVNKLTFTRNGSNIIRDITVNVVHSQGRLTNIPNKDATTKASPGLLIYNSYEQTIGTNSYSSVLSINTGGTIQIAGDWGDDHARNLYWRSQSDRNVADYPWKSWRTILDSENYSSTLDSRYYTESEVNSLLDAKLNRQNLSYGTWNPRGYHLAADYHYNGGDLSISENNGKMYISVDGCFWQNEGQYRVLDTSDIGDIRDSVTLHQYLSATDAAWYPLVWGGASHNNTSDSTGPIYKSYDKLCWQTSSQTLYATNIQTNNIKNLSIGGGIYWNPNVESATDGSDAASITLVRSGVAGGTTLVLSQMNDTNDTIQFKTNTAARLYHNSYPILTTQNTYVSNNKGYINGLEITQVNNADTLDGAHLSDIKNWSDRTASAYWKAGWYKVASAQTATNTEAFLTLDVNAAQSNGHATLFIRKRADSKPYFICTHNNNLNLADFRLYYNGMSMVLYARVPNDWNGRVFRIISEGREGTYDHIWTLYSNVSSTDPNAISAEGGNPYINPTYSGRVDWSNSSDKANYANSAGSATKLATPRTIWGQSFDGTGNVSGSLSEVGNIHFKVDNSYDIGSNAAASRCIYTHWLGARSGRKLELGANNSGFGQGLCIDTNLNVGIGTNTPAYKLDVKGDIYSSGYVRASSGFIKGSSSDSYVLLGGGGHKLESSLNVAYSKYLKGITLTGGDSNNAGYRLIFEKTMGGWTINYGVWAIALRHSGRGTLNIGFDTTNSDGSTYAYDIRFLGSTVSRESTPFRAFYNSTTKVFRIYWHYYDYTSGDIAVLRGNMEPHNGTWMASLPNDVGTELAITCNMADQAANADTVDGYHATDGRTFNGDIHWGSWNNTWSDGTHTHPWYGFDHRYPNTGIYSTTISDYCGMTIKTYNTLLLDCGTLLLNSRNNVGIGTTSPTQKLDVTGNIRATGQIIREGHSNIWVYGRSVALLRETSAVGYHTLWSLKTTNGSWDFGEYNAGSDWTNIPVLSYITDSNYNSGNNAPTYQIKFPLASGTVALTSNIPNPTNYYWANVKISASSSTTTSPTFSNVYLGNSLYLNTRGFNSIYNGPNDSANGVGGPLNNLVFSSWQGVSFTTSCAGLTYTNKNAVSINCRTGQLYAREVQANGFMHTGHNNNDAVLLAGGGYKTLKDFIFLNKSYNYTDNEHYNLNFHKLSGICNNLVWVDGHVKGSITKNFAIDPAVFPYCYDEDPNLNTIYLMSGENYITINTIGVVTINNATDHKQRVGFFYIGRA